MKDLHPSLLEHFQRSNLRASQASWGLVVVAWLLLASGMMSKGNNVRLILFGASFAACMVAKPVRAIAISTERTGNDISDISLQSFQNWLYERMKPEQTALSITTEQPLQFFQWERLKHEPDRFPHLAIIAPTGMGKTTLAEWLLYLVGGGSVITTKRKSSQWRGLEVVGTPRDFATIKAAFDALIQEMQRRTADLDQIDSYPRLNVAVDELAAIAKNVPDFQTSFTTLIREARETLIRLIVLLQGSQVKTFGLEGESDLMDCLTFIRLGEFAVEHCQRLVKKGLLSKDALLWLQRQSRPCMVGNELAIVPNLQGWSPGEVLGEFPKQGEFLGESGITHGKSHGQGVSAKGEQIIHPTAAPNLEAFEDCEPGESPGEFDDEELAGLIRGYRAQGLGQDEFITQVLGIPKAGNSQRYNAARDAYQRICQKFCL